MTEAVLFLLGFLFLLYSKVKNIIKLGEEHSFLRSSMEVGIGVIIFLIIAISNLASVHAANQQPFYLGVVFETSQYLLLAAFLLPLLLLLFFVEILMHFKIFVSRGRLKATD